MSCSGASASKASRGDSDQLDAISNTIDDLNAKIDNPEKLRPSLADAEKRAHARPAAPGLLIQPTKGDFDHPTYSSPWVDRNACELMLADTFATRSGPFKASSTRSSACAGNAGTTRQMWVRDEGELNQALNFINVSVRAMKRKLRSA